MDEVANYMPLLWKGFVLTVLLSFGALILATFLGIAGAIARVYGGSVAQYISKRYILLIRGIPDLVLMLLLFFGGQKIINDIGRLTGLWHYVDLNQFAVGVFTIGFIMGAYMTESFRGALLALDKGKIEAALACGIPRTAIFRRIMLVPLIFYVLPSFSNNTLVLIKTTALVSIIGLQDIVYNAFVAGKATSFTFTFLMVSFVAYLILTALLELIFSVTRKYVCHWATLEAKH